MSVGTSISYNLDPTMEKGSPGIATFPQTATGIAALASGTLYMISTTATQALKDINLQRHRRELQEAKREVDLIERADTFARRRNRASMRGVLATWRANARQLRAERAVVVQAAPDDADTAHPHQPQHYRAS